MTSKKNTNKALFSSVIALILCCSMLVGTTFAWFTDEVTSGVNKIVAGNLDVDVLTADGDSIQGIKTLFNDVTLWEPGVVAYENLTVVNQGNLALKYELSVNFDNENTVNGKGLSSALKVALVNSKVAAGLSRENVLALAGEGVNLSSFNRYDELDKGESKEYTLIIWWAPSANDNDWNVNNGKTTSDGKPLHIDLGVKLVATQKMAEEDSFGPEYDKDALAIDVSWYDPAKTEYVLNTAAELRGLAAIVNGTAPADATVYSLRSTTAADSFTGKTVKLGADINLGGKAWAPIGACNSAAYFQGTFDGQGHTIYNLSVDKSSDGYQYSTAGLFGWIDAGAATIKNVNLENATVMGSHWVGALVGYMTGTVENCSVNNSTVMGFNVNNEANGDKVGGLVGYMNSGAGKLDGNTVKNTKISGYRDVAGLAGAVATTNTVTNNKVENVEITYSNARVGKIVSTKTAVTVDETNTATNVTITRVIIAYTVAELNEALSALSGDALNTDAVLQNCDEPSGVVKIPGDYTGTLTLKDSAVASVQAAGAADLVIVGNVAVKATEEGMSAITGTKLNIAGNGNLTAIAEGNHAYGIGGDETAEINIKDVHIVDVKGGHVKAAITDNNYGKNEPEGGAAIGSGKDGAVITLYNVTIDNAQGGSKAAGIGARFHTGLTVNIQNSTIKNVEGGTSSAGIGGSRMTKHESGDTQNITINITNSRINAKGGDFAAGIGSGYNTYCSGVSPTPVISVTIDAASNITAQGGLLGAGIGTGHNALGFVGNIACDTSNVKAGSSEDPSWCCWGNPTTTAEDVGLGVLSIKNFPDKFGTYVNNADELAAALAAGQDVVLTDDVEMVSATTAPYGNKYAVKLDGGVLDGNGKELHMECYGDDYGIMTTGGTIKNITIQEGCRAVMIMYPKDDVILDNVNIGGEGVLYPINTGEAGANGVDLIVTNSTLAGWTSYGLIESASFTNVKFEQGTYNGDSVYGRVLKPYVNTTLTDCSFVEHMNLDLTALTNGHKITIKNCTVNGQVVNAGVFTIPTTDAQYNTELFTIDLPSWATSISDCVVFQ